MEQEIESSTCGQNEEELFTENLSEEELLTVAGAVKDVILGSLGGAALFGAGAAVYEGVYKKSKPSQMVSAGVVAGTAGAAVVGIPTAIISRKMSMANARETR